MWEPWPVPLEELAARHDARWAAQLHTGALEELMERFGERLRPEQDYLGQLLLLLGILRELELEGALQAWPRTVSAWPVPSERLVVRALDAFCPDGRGVLLGVFDRGEVATCLAARRSGGGFDLIVGPDELRQQMGLLSGDWTRDYRHLARVAELRVGPLALGCFGELATFQRLAAPSTAPGGWAAAVASRDLILAPVAPALAIPLGLDIGRAAVAAARDYAQRASASLWLAPEGPLASAFDRLGQIQVLDQDIKLLRNRPQCITGLYFVGLKDERGGWGRGKCFGWPDRQGGECPDQRYRTGRG